jgi:hypothetical protein
VKKIAAVVAGIFLAGAIYAPSANAGVQRKADAKPVVKVVTLEKERSITLEKER